MTTRAGYLFAVYVILAAFFLSAQVSGCVHSMR